jgi:hypothetical protein
MDSKWGELGNSRPFPVLLWFCRDRILLPKFRGCRFSSRSPVPMSPRDVASRSLCFLALFAVGRLRPPRTRLSSLCPALHCFEVFRHPCFWVLVSTYFLIESCPLSIDWERKLLLLSSWSCRFIYFCNLFLCVVVVVVVVCLFVCLQVAGILSGHGDVPQRAWMIENGYIIPLLYDASV